MAFLQKTTKSKLPTANDMKAFGARFEKGEWEKCVEYPEFLDAVATDLIQAERLAIDILEGNGKYAFPRSEQVEGFD